MITCVTMSSINYVFRELSFKKGDIIYIRRQIDKNWYEGEVNGMFGLLPVQYVDVSYALRRQRDHSCSQYLF